MFGLRSSADASCMHGDMHASMRCEVGKWCEVQGLLPEGQSGHLGDNGAHGRQRANHTHTFQGSIVSVAAGLAGHKSILLYPHGPVPGHPGRWAGNLGGLLAR